MKFKCFLNHNAVVKIPQKTTLGSRCVRLPRGQYG